MLGDLHQSSSHILNFRMRSQTLSITTQPLNPHGDHAISDLIACFGALSLAATLDAHDYFDIFLNIASSADHGTLRLMDMATRNNIELNREIKKLMMCHVLIRHDCASDDLHPEVFAMSPAQDVFLLAPKFPATVGRFNLADPYAGVRIIDYKYSHHELAPGLKDRLKNVWMIRHRRFSSELLASFDDGDCASLIQQAIAKLPHAIQVIPILSWDPASIRETEWPTTLIATSATRLVITVWIQEGHAQFGLPWHPVWLLVPPPSSQVVIVFGGSVACGCTTEPCCLPCCLQSTRRKRNLAISPVETARQLFFSSPGPFSTARNLIMHVCMLLRACHGVRVTLVHPGAPWRLRFRASLVRTMICDHLIELGTEWVAAYGLASSVDILTMAEYRKQVGTDQFDLEVYSSCGGVKPGEVV